MSGVSVGGRPKRGEQLLLRHVLAGRGSVRTTASERLERELGPRLARLLVSALGR
jgi:hypothetical protein